MVEKKISPQVYFDSAQKSWHLFFNFDGYSSAFEMKFNLENSESMMV